MCGTLSQGAPATIVSPAIATESPRESCAAPSEAVSLAVWARPARLPDGTRVLQLVDLRGQADDRWDAGRSLARPTSGWRIRWAGARPAFAMSPWTDGGRAAVVDVEADGTAALPAFRRWLVVVDPHGGR